MVQCARAAKQTKPGRERLTKCGTALSNWRQIVDWTGDNHRTGFPEGAYLKFGLYASQFKPENNPPSVDFTRTVYHDELRIAGADGDYEMVAPRITTTTPQPTPRPTPRPKQTGKGYNCLFVGHSFFVPVALRLPPLAAAAGLVNHKQTEVFSGGATGTPLALWNNAQKSSEIKKELDTGDVELFGMTFEPSAPTTEGYERWIEYALAKNKDTMFMVGIPWLDKPADVDTATYTAGYRAFIQQLPACFARLRAKFPGATIIENMYGTGAVELRLLFDQGKLPDVKTMTGGKTTSLFTDGKGHGGVILLDLASLFFLKRIYGVDPSKVPSDFSAYSTDLKAVAQSVLDAQDAQDAFRFCAPSDASCPGRSGGSTAGDAGGGTTPGTTASACVDKNQVVIKFAKQKGQTVTGCSDPVIKAQCAALDVLKTACCQTCSVKTTTSAAEKTTADKKPTNPATTTTTTTRTAATTATITMVATSTTTSTTTTTTTSTILAATTMFVASTSTPTPTSTSTATTTPSADMAKPTNSADPATPTTDAGVATTAGPGDRAGQGQAGQGSAKGAEGGNDSNSNSNTGGDGDSTGTGLAVGVAVGVVVLILLLVAGAGLVWRALGQQNDTFGNAAPAAAAGNRTFYDNPSYERAPHHNPEYGSAVAPVPAMTRNDSLC